MELKSLGLRKSLPLFISLFLGLGFWSQPLQAESHSPVRVAFFIGLDHEKRQIELSPGDSYFHVAIQIEGQWYHASVDFGVSKVKELLSLSDESLYLKVILESTSLVVSQDAIAPFLGLPFDYTHSWSRQDATNCTKFIAKILGVEPSPMTFESSYWRLSKGTKKNELGLSPDELYEALINKGFYRVSPRLNLRSSNRCQSLL
jgi:hypothetical protein